MAKLVGVPCAVGECYSVPLFAITSRSADAFTDPELCMLT